MPVTDLSRIFKAYDVRGIYGDDLDGDRHEARREQALDGRHRLDERRALLVAERGQQVACQLVALAVEDLELGAARVGERDVPHALVGTRRGLDQALALE